MSMNLSRGGAAALLTLGASLPLGAQSAGSLPPRARDSAAVQIMMIRGGRLDSTIKVRVDSIARLMRAYDEAQPYSSNWANLRRQIEELIPFAGAFERARGGGEGMSRMLVRPINPAVLPKGWIGFTTTGPRRESISDDGQIVTYFDYPTIVTVDGHSPAEQAGIMRGDVLVAYNGSDIVGRPLNLTQLLVPDKKVSVTIRREGETKDYSVVVAKAPDRIFVRRNDFHDVPPELERAHAETEARRAAGARGSGGGMIGLPSMSASGGSLSPGTRVFMIAPAGVFGASASPVGPELAKKLKLEMGILVNDVPEETPASRAGLRPGDVIVSVAGQQVASLQELQHQIEMRASDRLVQLRVVRDKKSRNITVSW